MISDHNQTALMDDVMFKFQPAQEDFAEVVRTRRTVHEFLDTPVDIATILQAIDLARWAPNHKLTEPWTFHILGPQSVRQLIDLNESLIAVEKGEEAARKKMARWSQIPGWMIVTCRKSSDPIRNEENYAAVCCALQNLMLFLWSRKVGTKWATSHFLQHPQVAKTLDIESATERIVGMIWYGYVASRSESRRRPVPEITVFHP